MFFALDGTIGAPVHEPALKTGVGWRTVRFPTLARVLGHVDVVGLVLVGLRGGEKGIVDDGADGVEFGGQGGSASVQEVGVNGT